MGAGRQLERAAEEADARAGAALGQQRDGSRHLARGELICAACSATFVCAEAGLLDGGPATTPRWLAPLFRARYPAVELRADAMVVRAGHLVTAGASAPDGCAT